MFSCSDSRTLPTGIDREKRLEELLEAVKHMCRTNEEKQAGDDYDFVWLSGASS